MRFHCTLFYYTLNLFIISTGHQPETRLETYMQAVYILGVCYTNLLLILKDFQCFAFVE